DGDELLEAHLAGLDVDRDLRELSAADSLARHPAALAPIGLRRDRLEPEKRARLLPREAALRSRADEDPTILRADLARLRLEDGSDTRDEIGERLLAAHGDREAHAAHRRAAAASSRARIGGATDQAGDVARLEAEDLGGDERNERRRAGSDVLRPAAHLDLPARVDRAGRLRLARGAAPSAQRATETSLDRPG